MQAPESSFPPAPARSYAQRNILFFCITTFLYWTTNYLFMPILSVYTQSLGAGLSVVGTIVAAYGLPQLLLRIPVGVAFDAVARKKLLLAAGIGAATIGAVGLGLAPNFGLLFLARFITGVGAACWVIFTIYFTAYYPPGGVQRALGLINFVQGMGVVSATLAGGFIAQAYGYKATFWGAGALGVLAIVMLLVTQQPAIMHHERFSRRNFTEVASRPLLLITSFMGILWQFANWSSLFGFTPVYGAQIGATKAELGILTMLAMGASAVISLAVPRLLKTFGTSLTISLSSVVLALSIAVTPLITSVLTLEAVMVVNGAARGILATCFLVLAVQAAKPGQRATAMGIYQAAYAVGMFLGPQISGFMADSFGLSVVFYLSAAISFIVGGIAYLPAVRKVKV